MNTENNNITIKNKQLLLDFINSDADALTLDIDFNFLMEVVEKINNTYIQGSPEIRIGKYFTEVFFNGQFSVFRITDSVSKIETVCFSCMVFIKWYNQQNK